MNRFTFIILIFIFAVNIPAFSCQSPDIPANIFTLNDAQDILGERAHLLDSSVKVEAIVITYNCSYIANSTDEVTGKLGNIYFMYEDYSNTGSAKEVYTSIKKANQDHEGFKVLSGVGDEGYFHSDNENFYFIMARKGNKMIRMKVNKVTSKTSLEKFNEITRKIIDKM